jgi:hypothetical protein
MKEVLNLQEAAELLCISPRALREAAAKGDVPGRKIANQWRFSRFVLHEWLNGEKPVKSSLLKWAGAFKDEPLFAEVIENIANERKRQREEAIREDQLSSSPHLK